MDYLAVFKDVELSGLIVWYAFLLAVVFLLQRETRCFTRFSVWSVFVVLLLLHCGVTAPFDRNVTALLDGMVVPDFVARRWWTGITIMFAALPAAAWLVNRLAGESWSSLRDRYRTPPDPGRRIPPAVLAGAGLAVIASALVFAQTDFGFTLVDLLSGRVSPETYAAGRASVGLSQDIAGSPMKHLVRVVFWGLLPTVLCVLVGYGKKRRDALVLACLLGGAFGIQGLLSGQKEPVLFLLVTVWFAWRVGGGRRQIPIGSATIWLSVGLVLFVALPYLYYLQYPFLDYTTRLFNGLFRLTSESNRVLLYYFNFYPDRFGFLHGASSNMVGGMLGIGAASGTPERAIPVYMLGPDYLNTWNTAFVGYAWTDFGIVGVIVGSIGLGCLLQFVHLWFDGTELDPLHAGVLTGLGMAASRFAESSITATLLTFGFGISLLLYALPGLGWAIPRSIGVTKNA